MTSSFVPEKESKLFPANDTRHSIEALPPFACWLSATRQVTETGLKRNDRMNTATRPQI